MQVARPGLRPGARVRRLPARRPAARTAAVRCTQRAAARCPSAAGADDRATAWACPNCASTRVRMASSGSERTADELGRAFPGIRIIVADGEHPDHSRSMIDRRSSSRPAAPSPIAQGGYRAVILLDGDRMLLAEDLRIGESCLRWWSNAAALAAPGAPVHLVGVTGAVARALATWTQPAYARAELADRAPLRMPPTVRVAALEGAARAVDAALAALREAVPALDDEAVLGPVDRRCGTPGRSCASTTRTAPRVTESLRGVDRRRCPPALARTAAKGRAAGRAQYTQSAGRRARPRPVRNAMRLVFAGTPDAAVPSLRRARGIRSRHRRGRHASRRAARPQARADALAGRRGGRRARTRRRSKTDRLDDAATERIAALEPDLGVIVAYGGLVREPLLSAPAHGWINLHFSLLPRWRGAAPVQHALIAGDAETGASVFQLVAGPRCRRRVRRAALPVRAGRDRRRRPRPTSRSRAPTCSPGSSTRIAAGTAVAVPQSGEPTSRPSSAMTTAASGGTRPRDAVLGAHPRRDPRAGRAHDHRRRAAEGARRARRRLPDAPRLDAGRAIACTSARCSSAPRPSRSCSSASSPPARAPMSAADWWRGRRDAETAARFGS